MSSRTSTLPAAAMAFILTLSAGSAEATDISDAEVFTAQQAWCEYLTGISMAYAENGKDAAKKMAEEMIDESYGYQMGPVLFKPTMTVAPQTFRTTRAGALSYFVGNDLAFPQDTGFALKNWTKCSIDNAAIFIAGDTAWTMGNVSFTNKDGEVTLVDKTWTFLKDQEGNLRIMVHHSSLPYISD